MDCNKDEAIRAKELAEQKFGEMDAAGAKRFALKAQNLYPELDGLPELLATLDVYISADIKINGEADWYSVLGVQPSANEDIIRKHYKKLALILHPDKNKSVGAGGAFKILSEAWSLLSDKAKRTAYDLKRNLVGSYTNVLHAESSSPTQTSHMDFHNLYHRSNQNDAIYSRPAPPHSARNHTFWTTCNTCKMSFEYLRVYVDANIACCNCCDPFVAVEKPAPPVNGSCPYTSSMDFTQKQKFPLVHNTELGRFSGFHSSTSSTQQQKPAPPVSDSSPYTPSMDLTQQQKFPQVYNTGLGRFSGMHSATDISLEGTFSKSGTNINMAPPAHFTAQAAHVSHSASETLKTGHKESETVILREGSLPMKFHPSQKLDADLGKSFRTKMKKPSKPTIQNVLMEMAKKEICKKLNSWCTASLSKASNKSKPFSMEMDEKVEGNGEDALNMKPDAHKSMEFVDIKSSIEPKKSYTVDADVGPATNEPDPMSMTVPDPDFHDFDKDRIQRSFGQKQVWAAYDDDDGMPRYYAMIHGVISLKPFKMRISWLNSKSNVELAPLNWIGSGFQKTSGDFWVGKHKVTSSLNSFSHRVKWSKGRKGAIQIYPRKGDVWALYRNWSSDWNELTPDEVIHKYDMVEVLEDYNGQNGVAVAPLVKVPGFKTVFQKHSMPSKTWMISREELFRLSHQVPSYLLTRQEGPNAPNGCLELDPAATPLELLQVLTEAQVKEVEDITERAWEETVLGDSKRSEDLIENDQKMKPNIDVEGVGQAVMKEEMKEENKRPRMLVYSRRQRRKLES